MTSLGEVPVPVEPQSGESTCMNESARRRRAFPISKIGIVPVNWKSISTVFLILSALILSLDRIRLQSQLAIPLSPSIAVVTAKHPTVSAIVSSNATFLQSYFANISLLSSSTLDDSKEPWFERRLVPAFKPFTRENYPLRIEEATSDKVPEFCPQKPGRDYNKHPVVVMSLGILRPASVDPDTGLVNGVINPESRKYEYPCPVPCKSVTISHDEPYVDLFLSAGERTRQYSPVAKMAEVCPLTKAGEANMECESYYPTLGLDSLSTKYDFTATTDLRSDVPLVYMNRLEYDLWAPVKPKTASALAIAIISNCDRKHSDRLNYIKELRDAGLDVDFTGSCGDKRSMLLRTASRQQRIDFQATYKFSLAFENSQHPDYVTEKLYFALEAGSVPVVRGAPNTVQLAPPNSIINSMDYKSAAELVQYLKYLASPDGEREYEKYMEWKKDPHCFDNFLNKTQDVHSFCRACIWVKKVLDFELGERS